MLSLEFDCNCCNKGRSAFLEHEVSASGRITGNIPKGPGRPAPARRRSGSTRAIDTKMGTAPSSITTRVWSEVPDAIFVSAQSGLEL